MGAVYTRFVVQQSWHWPLPLWFSVYIDGSFASSNTNWKTVTNFFSLSLSPLFIIDGPAPSHRPKWSLWLSIHHNDLLESEMYSTARRLLLLLTYISIVYFHTACLYISAIQLACIYVFMGKKSVVTFPWRFRTVHLFSDIDQIFRVD